jgi:hypothetical protein
METFERKVRVTIPTPQLQHATTPRSFPDACSHDDENDTDDDDNAPPPLL